MSVFQFWISLLLPYWNQTDKKANNMKINGITDTITTCDCCGRTGLARTVCFESDSGDLSFVGTICASAYARKNSISYGLNAVEVINSVKSASKSFKEFTIKMKSKGFGNIKTLSPIFDNVPCVTWVWNDVQVKFTDF
jgi:hypothetical protein